MVAILRLKRILEPVIARVERELGIRILWDVVGDQKNTKYVLKIAGSMSGEIIIPDIASDDVIASRMYASLNRHFEPPSSLHA
ncbi:MAG: hypothetical protein QOC81_4841 [Thermoanaerobaculia bacterium]|jgi:hypothetical protein|nr:hypothetical protein [Thermoanaerobaculia bacterium]